MRFRPDRLKARRLELKMSQQELADAIGVSQKAVGKWESGRTKTRPSKLKELSEVLGVRQDWLLDRTKKRVVRANKVGVISWVQAGEIAEVIDNYEPGDAEQWVDFPMTHSNMIALEVRGNSMNKVSPEGSIIIVDLRERQMTSNRYYIVKIGNEATFKQYKSMPPRLVPVSTDEHETIFLDNITHETIGRVVRTQTDFR